MATKLWSANALAIPQIQTYAPGPQLPNTTISATINGKTASYTSATGSNDDLIAGLIKAIGNIVQQAPEFAEVSFTATVSSPAVPAPNATYLTMQSKTAGVPFTVSISLTNPAKANVTRVVAGKAGVNELQQITISPNAESGSSFTLTWGGHTTGAIPTPASALTSATGSSGSLTGAYKWAVTFVTSTGETELGLPSASLTLAAQQASLTNIPLGPSGTTSRKIYRTKAGGSVYYLSHAIADNTTTTYTDNNSDTTIGANPGPPATNGVLQGELEALTGIGQGNVKVGGVNAAAYPGQVGGGYSAGSPPVTGGQFNNPPTQQAPFASTGGSLAGGTYYYVVTEVVFYGGVGGQNQYESVGSNEKAVAVTGPNGSVTINFTSTATTAQSIYRFNVYRGSSPGAENILVGSVPVNSGDAGGTAYTFTDLGSSTGTAGSPIVYTIEFRGSLASASQALVSGNVANVTILPPVSISTVTVGCPPQNEVQTIGWQQVTGTLQPTGTFNITLPGLNVTTAAILFNASAASVQAALVAAAGPTYANAFSVVAGLATSASYTWAITYQGALGLQAVPQAVVNVAGMVAAAGDTVTAYQTRTQKGTATGRNSTVTVTLLNGPTGGTFGVSGTLANGTTISASSVAYNATAATLQGDFPANTVSVSGSAGGPYTIEAVGEASSQAITWTASSSLTGGSSVSGSPPGSNTTALSAPSVSAAASLNGNYGMLSGAYYWKVTAYDSAGETTGSNQVSINPGSAGATLTWNAVPGATGYKVYRGTSSGSENTLIANLAATIFGSGSPYYIDYGGTDTTATPPSNSSNLTGWTVSAGAPLNQFFNGVGNLSTGTYYYLLSFGGQTAEFSVSLPTAGDYVTIQPPSGIAGGTLTVYRGTSSGGENVQVISALYGANSTTLIVDTGPPNSANSPPGSNSSGISAPTQSNTSPSSSGGNLASNTYYYEVTATNSAGETTASNEKTAAVTGPTGSVTISWGSVTGASGYKIYRGTSTGGENVLVGQVNSGSTTSYVDVGTVPATFACTEIAQGTAAVNEQQLITLTGATGGTFTLAFEGQQTGNLPYSDTSADVQTQLQTLSTVGSGNLTVSGSAGGPYTVTAAGSLAGTPLPLIAANSTNLVGSSTSTASLTTVQAATGPNFWDNAQNWSPTGVPANGDSVYFQNSNVDCLYNIAQSSTTLANLQIDMSYVGGEIGLPNWNGKYFEYRQQYLAIGVSGTVLIGNGKGSGPTLVKLDTGTNATTFLINGCGTSLDPTLPAILWRGNRASGTSTITINKGSIGIALFAGETATIDQINQGYQQNVKSDSNIYVGPGTTIGTQWYMTGGAGTLNANCPSLVMENGTLSILDGLTSTAVATLSIIGGYASDLSTGTITALTVGTGATYDRSDDSRAKTVTNATITGKATFLDPNDTITFTNPLTLTDCGLLDVTLDLGTNITLQRNPITVSAVLQSNAMVQGRLTLSSTLPVTTNDVTGAGTLYLLPFRGDKVAIFNGSIWQTNTIPSGGVSLSLSGLTASLPYDVFAYLSGNTVTLQAVAWTNATTRATALATQNGIYVKSGSPGYLYLGTFYTTGTGTTEDSQLNRLCWNYYNRVRRPMARFESTASWTYATQAWRQANANTANQLAAVVGVAEVMFSGRVACLMSSTGGTVGVSIGIGTNSTTAPDATVSGMEAVSNASGYYQAAWAALDMAPAAGYNYWAWLEYANTATSVTFYGPAGTPVARHSGIAGSIEA
jgi:hypothetical protein